MKHLNAFLALTGASFQSDTPVLGQITVANATQNYAGSLAQDVQGYLAGMPSTNEEERLNALFPGLQTNDFFQFAKADDEAFLTEADDSDIRGVGAAFKRVEYRGTTATAATQQKGLTMRVDHKTLPKVNGAIVSGWENRYAAALKARLIRADIVRGIAVVHAASTDLAVTFSSTTNPDGLLRAMVQTGRTASGLIPTHVVIGNSAWQSRQDSYENAARVNHSMSNHAGYSLDELARYLGVQKVIIEDGMKQTVKGAAKADRLALLAYSYSALESPIMDDPSNIKRAYSPVTGGGEWAVAVQEAAVYTDITVWHESLIFAPITTGVRRVTITHSAS
jgi:hypothetical protein